ncbi:MAG TPA: hypothetical protein VNP73_08230, partial [Actinomycetota bacterium]|nr:hypothetical protein [Actinomycetota bacterium]
MAVDYLDKAIEYLEKVNAGLEPELMPARDTQTVLKKCARARARALLDFTIASLSRKQDDPERLARVTGTSIGKAKETVATGKAIADSGELSMALQQGQVSLDQASEIAK